MNINEFSGYYGARLAIKALPDAIFPLDPRGKIDVESFESEHKDGLLRAFRFGIDFNLEGAMN
jgi:hypothetical protein